MHTSNYLTPRWLREQHAVAASINLLFSESLESRLKMYVSNPLHVPSVVAPDNRKDGDKNRGTIDTPNVTVFANKVWPISSSTPLQPSLEDSTLYETTAFSMAKMNDTIVTLDQAPADMVVKNPLFTSGLQLRQVRN